MQENEKITGFIQQNSLDGALNRQGVKGKDFLQSAQWRKFQEAVGRKIFHLENDTFSASIVEHILPIVGKYFYVPRGPVFMCHSERSVAESKNPETNNTGGNSSESLDKLGMTGIKDLTELAKKNNAGWIRIDPASGEVLKSIKENILEKIVKAPHDMQPREIFVIDIRKPEEQLLAEMKAKTRYNIGLAQKKGVRIVTSHKSQVTSEIHGDAFLRLTKDMARRQGISVHSEQYYRKMIETLPPKMLKIYVAEYDGKIIAANSILFFGDTATYLHGASGNEHRNLMAPFLLQWQAILDAKKRGCVRYDMGGVKMSHVTCHMSHGWEGITKFKTGFSPLTAPVVFPGSYDIIINPMKYAVYRGLQRVKELLVKIQK
jgi:lipid II:glycine glycyltransferase (peptidoglycan interpeptide bridge formation enzyme)